MQIISGGPLQFNCCCFLNGMKTSLVKWNNASILPNCFSPLISLKTVNEQREKKVGELLWLPNDRDSVGFCVLPGRVQTISLPHDCCSHLRFALLRSSSKFAGPQRKLSLCIFFFPSPFALFKHLSLSFSMWALLLSGAVCTFHQQTRKKRIKKKRL